MPKAKKKSASKGKANGKATAPKTLAELVLPQWWGPFFDALAKVGVMRYASEEAGIGRQAPYSWIDTDPEVRRPIFEAAVAEAMEASTHVLEREAVRRAVEGTEKPVFHQGIRCGAVQQYSDLLLIFLLRARNPAKYRDAYGPAKQGQAVEIETKDGTTVRVVQADLQTPVEAIASENMVDEYKRLIAYAAE